MAVDKLVDSSQLNSDLTSVANAIRTKGGTQGQLAFPNGFVSAIQNIPSGDNVLVVTLSWDDDYFGQNDGAWIPDKTFAQISAAYSAGKEIATEVDPEEYYTESYQVSGGVYDDEFVYCVTEEISRGQLWRCYRMTSNGITNDGSASYYTTNSATISSNGQLLNGIKAVGSGGTLYTGNIPTKTSSDLTASGATVTAPAGYYASAASKAIANATRSNAITVGSDGLITSTHNILTEGYLPAGSQQYTKQLTTQAAQTIHPSTSDQTIASQMFLTGAQTIKAVTLTNLLAENIKSDVTVKIGDSTDDDCVASVLGTYTGSGGGTSSYTLLDSTEFTVSTTSTSQASVGGVAGAKGIWTTSGSKIIYVRIRDKAGPREGYFYGSDAWFINYSAVNGATSNCQTIAQFVWRYTASGYAATTGKYGVYAYELSRGQDRINIYRRYNSTNTTTINGTFKVDVYVCDLPTGVNSLL